MAFGKCSACFSSGEQDLADWQNKENKENVSKPRAWIDPLEEARAACDQIAAAPEPSREEMCRRLNCDPFNPPSESREWDGDEPVEPVDEWDELGEAGW